MLVDVTKCIGCQGCQVSCKNWNDKQADKTTLGTDFGNPSTMNSNTYTVVKFDEAVAADGNHWHFTKAQCMHCKKPACAGACPSHALTKTEAGPVVYHRDRCIGCRYCMLACPFEVPTFDWHKAIPSINKCSFCADRVASGIEPACSRTCPSGALTFGNTEDIVKLAEGRIAAHPEKYVNYIYGKDEAGGTSWLYISDTDFKNLPLDGNVEKEAYDRYGLSVMNKVPGFAIGAAALMAGFFFISGRKASAGKDGDK
jgi:formate dehydrogenase iron-sulfur subunit